MNKKILFIALHYPPSEGVADIRATNIAKNLEKNNFEVTVLSLNKDYYIKKSTKLNDEIERIKTLRVKYFLRLDAGNVKGNVSIPYIFRRIILKILPYIGLDYLFFWQRNAIKKVLKENVKYDFILATGPPFSNFLLAKRLSKKLKVKFLIDYRDPWTLTAHGTNASKNWINKKIEQSILNSSSLVVFNSPSMQKVMLKRFKINNSIVMTNGFDKEVFKAIPVRNFEKFTISYVGNFYVPKREIDPIFKAFKEIKEKNFDLYSSINFIYCGRRGKYIDDKAAEYDIAEVVENRYLVPREESFFITKNSHLSIIITSVFEKGNLSDRSIIPGKVFEALGMNKRILEISPKGSDINEIISKNQRGYGMTGFEITEIINAIEKEFLNKEALKFENDNSEFEWSNLIKKLIQSLKKIN